MAEYSGFFDGNNSYNQVILARMFDNLYSTGIAMIQENTISFNMTDVGGGIRVDKGFAIINGFYYYLNAPLTIPVSYNATAFRGGLFIGLDITTKKISLYKKEGTTYPSPTRNSNVYELRLCIYVTNSSDNKITISDNRLNNSFCTILRPKGLHDFNIFLSECKNQWNAKEWQNIYVQADTPTPKGTNDLWYQYI